MICYQLIFLIMWGRKMGGGIVRRQKMGRRILAEIWAAENGGRKMVAADFGGKIRWGRPSILGL